MTWLCPLLGTKRSKDVFHSMRHSSNKKLLEYHFHWSHITLSIKKKVFGANISSRRGAKSDMETLQKISMEKAKSLDAQGGCQLHPLDPPMLGLGGEVGMCPGPEYVDRGLEDMDHWPLTIYQ